MSKNYHLTSINRTTYLFIFVKQLQFSLSCLIQFQLTAILKKIFFTYYILSNFIIVVIVGHKSNNN